MSEDRPPLLTSLVRSGAAALVTAVLHPLATVAWWGSPRRGMELLRQWDRVLQRLFQVRLEVEDHNDGRYDRGPYVFVLLNQRSLAETFVAHAALPVPLTLFTNIEYALIPFVGWTPLLTGSVIVFRQWEKQRRRALDRAVEKVRAGHSFYISIEGARSPTGALLPYKKGPSRLAIQSGGTVVPVIFEGAERVLPIGEWRIRPGTIRVKLLEAIPTAGLTADDRQRLTDRLEQLAREHVGASAAPG